MTTDCKVPLIASRPNLPAHSAMSRMKKVAAELRDQSTPLGKALYAEKRLIEAVDKYILAKSDAAKAWSNCMQEESNLAIKALYQHISELDGLWVMLYQRYRIQLPEHRRLFKQIMSGEQELAKLHKHATAAAARTTKLGKQLDESLLKQRPNKALDMKKLETLEADLRKAVKEDHIAQRQYAMAVGNHKKFKHKEVKKTLASLAEVENQLYQDCWKISEVKSMIIQLYLDHRSDELTEINVHRAANESREAVNALYKELGTAVIDESEQVRPVQPAVLQHPSQSDQPVTGRVLPSAPPAAILEQTDGTADDTFPCYTPIPEIDSDNEEYEPTYIYEFEDDFDEEGEDEFYEIVTESKEQNYLDLIDNNSPNAESESETEVAAQSGEEIFGSIASLNLRPRNSLATDESPVTNHGDYGREWQARSSRSNNNNNNNNRRHPNGRALSQSDSEVPRYVKYPGSIGEKPAVSSTLEEELRHGLQRLRERQQKKQQVPPVPPRRN